MKGPKGEIFQLSSTTAPARHSTEVARQLLQEAEQRALTIIMRIEQNPSFQTFQPLSSEQLADGSSFHHIISMTKDGKRLLVQYVIAGPRTVLFGTLDVPDTDLAAAEDIAAMLRNVQWRR